jgi:hypothetical protein
MSSSCDVELHLHDLVTFEAKAGDRKVWKVVRVSEGDQLVALALPAPN